MASTNTGGPFKDHPEETKDVSTSQSQATDASVSSLREVSDNAYGSTDEHVFSDPSIAEYWRKVYEKAQYENRHRFDPSYQWSAEEEKKLVRKVRLTDLLTTGQNVFKLMLTWMCIDRQAHHGLGLGHVLRS